MKTLYHGTSPEAATSMLANGIDLFHRRKSDPGDFGRGFYVTPNIDRANAYGTTILLVTLDVSSYAYIPSPYDPDASDAGRLFKELAFDAEDHMRTCCGIFAPEERHATCSLIRERFLKAGWKGIVSDYDGEIVVFDLETIKKLERKG